MMMKKIKRRLYIFQNYLNGNRNDRVSKQVIIAESEIAARKLLPAPYDLGSLISQEWGLDQVLRLPWENKNINLNRFLSDYFV